MSVTETEVKHKTIKSPCIKMCNLLDGQCTGCKRTLEEIANWSNMSPLRKELILDNLNERK